MRSPKRLKPQFTKLLDTKSEIVLQREKESGIYEKLKLNPENIDLEVITPDRGEWEGKPLEPTALCTSCRYLPLHPKTCNQCSAILCSHCQDTNPNHSTTCPICKGENPKYIDPPAMIKAYFGGIGVSCIYAEDGCTQRLTLLNVRQHQTLHCPYRLTLCQYCSSVFKYREIAQHMEGCLDQHIYCDICQIDYAKGEAKIHDHVQTLRDNNKLLEFNISRNSEKEHKIDKGIQDISTELHIQEQTITRLTNSLLILNKVGELESMAANLEFLAKSHVNSPNKIVYYIYIYILIEN